MLADESCVAPKPGDKPLTEAQAAQLAPQITGWKLSATSLEQEFRLSNFREAMTFVNRVADIANAEDHHPDISISYNRVRLTLSTHKISGLSRNDFIMAAKIDRVWSGMRGQGDAD